MIIEKRHFAKLDMVYAIAAMEIDGRSYCLCASEKRDCGCLLIQPETGEVHKVWDGPGGVMSVLPVEGEQAFLSIEKFFPVFDSAQAVVNRNEIHFEGGRLVLKKTKLCDFPYVHRISLISDGDETWLVGGSLCEKKDFVDDWFHPGGVFVGKYRQDKPVALEEIYHGLTKNHGMFVHDGKNGKPEVLIGASEGILRVSREAGKWCTELLNAGETSDIWMADFDGDSQEEAAVIQGFHGNHIRILKENGADMDCIGELPLEFGHVLWAGQIMGELCLIGGSRGGERELTLYRVKKSARPEFEAHVIDKGVGPTQICVTEMDGKPRIFAANHGAGDVDMYTLSW